MEARCNLPVHIPPQVTWTTAHMFGHHVLAGLLAVTQGPLACTLSPSPATCSGRHALALVTSIATGCPSRLAWSLRG